jgi:hypothetical protein
LGDYTMRSIRLIAYLDLPEDLVVIDPPAGEFKRFFPDIFQPLRLNEQKGFVERFFRNQKSGLLSNQQKIALLLDFSNVRSAGRKSIFDPDRRDQFLSCTPIK